MDWPENWYTAKAFWVGAFKQDPESLEWFLRTWRFLGTWLVEGRKETYSVERGELFSAMPERPRDISPEAVWIKGVMFCEMTDLLVTWADLTIHPDSNALLRVRRHVSWLSPTRHVTLPKRALSRDWDEALLVFQRLWFQMEIRKRPNRRKGRNKYLEQAKALFQNGEVLDGAALAEKLKTKKDNVHQIMHRLKPHGFGRVGKRGYGKLTDKKS